MLTTCLALTFLNPHVYLDTVVLLGSLAHQHDPGAWVFGAGAVLASIAWFTALGFGAAYLRPVFARPRAWQVLDIVIAVVMATLAVTLLRLSVSAPRSTRPASQTGSGVSTTSPSAPNTRNRSKVRVNQRSCVTARTVPSNAARPGLERLGRVQVEVVRRLVEQQQRRSPELEQQDLQARLLTAGERLVALLGRGHELVPVERLARLLAADARAVPLAAVQDLQQRPADELRVPVVLREPARAARAGRGRRGRCA